MTRPLPRRFIFLRHGRTDWNRRGLVMGVRDVPLDGVGRLQAATAGAILAALPITSVWRSPLGRCGESLSLAMPGAPLPAQVLPGLAERNWGVWEGRPAKDRPPRAVTPEGGESLAVFRERTLSALEAIDDDGLPLVVAHSGTYRVVMERAGLFSGGAPLANAWPMAVILRPMPRTSPVAFMAATA